MLIKVLEVKKTVSDDTLVRFTSDYGSATGMWMDDDPQPGRACTVDIEIDDTFTWGENIWQISDGDFDVEEKKDGIYMKGIIENVDEYGMGALRVGDTTIVIEFEGKVPKIPKDGLCVCLTTAEIELHERVGH